MEFLIPSHRQRPADDPIFALNTEANARRKRGEAVINATVGALLNDDGTLSVLPTVAEALREVPAVQAASYAPLAGPAAFHAAVIGELFAGHPLAEHAIAVATPGGTGALRLALANFLEPGQSLLTSSFYWGPYRTLADESDRGLATFPTFVLDATGRPGELDIAAFDAALSSQLAAQGRALVFLNDPCQNPTGYSMRDHEWRALVEAVERNSTRGVVTLLVDVAYYLYGSGDPRAFLQHLTPLLGKVALCFAWSGSKSYTAYGARIGALVVCDPDAERRKSTLDALTFSCRGTWSNCNHAGMLAVARIVGDPAMRARVDDERDALRRLLDGRVRAFNAASEGTSLVFPRYAGGFFSTVFVPSGKRVAEVAARLREDGVFVVPQGEGLRVALCSVAERDVPRLVSAMDRALLA